MRKLPATAQEERRRQVIGLRQRGLSYREIAGQEAKVQGLIRRHTPEEVGLPFAPWGRVAAGVLIEQCCGVRLAVRTVGKYLARWGFTAQKPIRRAYEQDPAAVRRWLRRDYPQIVERARPARGVVVWGDETGLRSDDVRGRSYAPRGRTPVWLAEPSAEIEVFYPPTNSPDLNPDEGVHADLKQTVPRNAPARSKQQLKRAVISHRRSLANRPKPHSRHLPAPSIPLRRMITVKI